MRATLRAIRGAAILAHKYGVGIADVLHSYKNVDDIALELRVDGYAWDTRAKRWLISEMKHSDQPEIPVTRLKCSIRLIAEDEIAANIAALYIKGALKSAGYQVTRESEVKKDFSGTGARIYMDVEL